MSCRAADKAAAGPLGFVRRDLLRAAFRSDAKGEAAWRRWRATVDWEEHIDHETFRLLPRVCANLQSLGLADPLLARFRGISRHSWASNRSRWRCLQPTIRALTEGGTGPLLLPPTSLLASDETAVVDERKPLRLAVRWQQAGAAVGRLRDAGWESDRVRLPRASLRGFVLGTSHVEMRNQAGSSLELWWSRQGRDVATALPPAVWERARSGRLAEEAVLVPEAADALCEICSRDPAPELFAAIGDLLLTARSQASEPDAVPSSVEDRPDPIVGTWDEVLAELRELLPDLVPAALCRRAARAAERPARAPFAPASLRGRLGEHWGRYRSAWGQSYSLASALWQLPGYCQAHWELSSLRRLPVRFWRGLRAEMIAESAGRPSRPR